MYLIFFYTYNYIFIYKHIEFKAANTAPVRGVGGSAAIDLQIYQRYESG